MPEEADFAFFRLFTEIGILEQLSRTMFQRWLPKGYLMPHFTVLNHLTRVKDGQTPLDLASAFQVAKTTMTHTLSGLEKGGLVEMRPHEKDARSKRVWLTQQGREFRDDAIRAVATDIGELGQEFSQERVRRILPDLEDLRKIMDAQRNPR